MKDDIISTAIRTIQLEAESIAGLTNFIGEDFEKAVETIYQSTGRLIISGIGKSAIVAQKIVATLNSTGTPSIFMHAADAIHGDLGMVREADVVMVISKSGESPEIKVLLPLLKNMRNCIIGMTGNDRSVLARQCDFFLNTTVSKEACPNNLAPTSSTTAQMVIGDAIAVCLMERRGFTSEDFAKIHPGGNLGKRLYLRVDELSDNNLKPVVKPTANLKEVIVEISKNRLGATAVVDDNNILVGVITDGDLRRMLATSTSLEHVTAEKIFNSHPKTIGAGELAVNALAVLREFDISQLIVISETGVYAGMVHLHDLIREGIV